MNLLIPLIATCLTSMCLNIVPVDNPRDFNQKVEFNKAVSECIQSAICVDFLDLSSVPETSMKYITKGLSIPDFALISFTTSDLDCAHAYTLPEFTPLSILQVTSTILTI